MSGAAALNEIHVLVGLLRDARGRWLVAQRPQGKELAGFWEFPGGKRAAGEARLQALERELREELGIEVLAASPLLAMTHDYPDKRVQLDVWLVERFRGTPASLEGQALDWVETEALDSVGLLPADRPLVEKLRALDR